VGDLNKGYGFGTGVISVSCPAAGSCAAGGTYSDRGHAQAFVATEAKGRWGKAIKVPGTTALSYFVVLNGVSCSAAGSCAAGGFYGFGHEAIYEQAFVVTEAKGRWGKAIEVPGMAALNKYYSVVASMSCTTAGSCTAGGYYTDGSFHEHAFVVGKP
jgi:hypothetical protein